MFRQDEYDNLQRRRSECEAMSLTQRTSASAGSSQSLRSVIRSWLNGCSASTAWKPICWNRYASVEFERPEGLMVEPGTSTPHTVPERARTSRWSSCSEMPSLQHAYEASGARRICLRTLSSARHGLSRGPSPVPCINSGNGPSASLGGSRRGALVSR